MSEATPTPLSPVHAARLGMVGAAFLRQRPRVVGPTALLILLALARADVPRPQFLALGCGLSVMVSLFMLEAWPRRRGDAGSAAGGRAGAPGVGVGRGREERPGPGAPGGRKRTAGAVAGEASSSGAPTSECGAPVLACEKGGLLLQCAARQYLSAKKPPIAARSPSTSACSGTEMRQIWTLSCFCAFLTSAERAPCVDSSGLIT